MKYENISLFSIKQCIRNWKKSSLGHLRTKDIFNTFIIHISLILFSNHSATLCSQRNRTSRSRNISGILWIKQFLDLEVVLQVYKETIFLLLYIPKISTPLWIHILEKKIFWNLCKSFETSGIVICFQTITYIFHFREFYSTLKYNKILCILWWNICNRYLYIFIYKRHVLYWTPCKDYSYSFYALKSKRAYNNNANYVFVVQTLVLYLTTSHLFFPYIHSMSIKWYNNMISINNVLNTNLHLW